MDKGVEITKCSIEVIKGSIRNHAIAHVEYLVNGNSKTIDLYLRSVFVNGVLKSIASAIEELDGKA